MKKIKVLLTGGSGLVGRNFLEHSEIEKYEILFPRSKELDLLDFISTQEFLYKHQPDLVIHAAGKVGGIQANMREPVGFLVENMDMGRNIVLASYRAGVKRLINLGSSCMYPRNHCEPLNEDMVLKGELEPTNEGYALAKVMTSRLCDYIVRENSDFQYKTLIPCNIYGRFDKFDPSNSHLVPAIIHKIHQAKSTGKETVEIWGDGTARREFMYAGDLADAMAKSITNFETLPSLMNVGLGEDHTINQYYAEAADIIGYTGNFVHDLSKPVGMARKLVSIERLRSWGWSAKHDLRDGIEKTYQYYLEEIIE